MIVIDKPKILEINNKAQLVAKIKINNKIEKNMYFEVDKKYEKYLCDNVGDAFLVGLLNFAFANGYDIKSEAPISERLLYQIKTYILPTLPVTGNKYYKHINIYAEPYTNKIVNIGAVGTSASGGVDSYYSIVRHIKENKDDISFKYKLTHLLIANQFNFYENEKIVRKRFNDILEEARDIANNYNLELIGIFTNHNDFLFDGFIQQYTFRICSYVLALQKLFSVYYVSSGVSFKNFSFNNHDSDGFDIFNLFNISTDNITFYSSGGEKERSEKIQYISSDLFIQEHLKVCNEQDKGNCSKCEKCMRTMLVLDVTNKLNYFNKIFNISLYKKRKRKFLSIVKSGQLEASLDLLNCMRKNNYSINIFSILEGYFMYKPLYIIKEYLKDIYWVKKLYYFFCIDYIRFGKQKALKYRYTKFLNKKEL